MYSSRTRPRRRGAIAAPIRLPPTLAARMTPYHHAGACVRRKAKATRKTMKPTVNRNVAMATAAAVRPPGRQVGPGLKRDTGPVSASASGSRARRRGCGHEAQGADGAQEEHDAVDSQQGCRSEELQDGNPGMEAMKPAMAPPTASLELASTRSSLCSTTAGTMAALATV